MKIKTFKCNNKACNLPISYDEDALTPMGLNVTCTVCQHNHFLKIRISQPPPPSPPLSPPPPPSPPPMPSPPPPSPPPMPSPPPPSPVPEDLGFLMVQDGSQRKLMLKLGRNVLGRANQTQVQPDLPIVTQDARMSKRHCVVEVVQTAYGFQYHLYDIGHVEAQGSTNGTFLQNEVLSKRAADGKLVFSIAALDANAVFRIGNTQISLQMDSPHLFKVGAGGTIVL